VVLPRLVRAARLLADSGAGASEALWQSRAQAAFASGIAEGERRTLERISSSLQAAQNDLAQARAQATSELAASSVRLALAIAQELLRCEIEQGRYDLEGLVRGALERAGPSPGPCILHVHPEDAQRLSAARFRPGLSIESDSSLGRGSFHLSTPQGLLVRDLRESLDAVGEALQEALS
jgi:flagellar biosynthesis/type III secretory pathway protein FliH